MNKEHAQNCRNNGVALEKAWNAIMGKKKIQNEFEMGLLEELLICRDEYERCGFDIPNINDSIDKIITEGMQKRRI